MIVQHLVEAMLAEAPIAAIVANRIYPNEAPDAPEFPYLVVSKIDGEGEYDFAGDVGIERARVEINVYSTQNTGYTANVALKGIVRTFVTSRPPPGPPCVIDSARCITDMDSPAAAPVSGTNRAGPRVRRRLLEFWIFCRP